MWKRIAGPKPSDLSYMGEHYTVLHYTTHVLCLILGPDRGGVWGVVGCGGGFGAIVPLSVLIAGLRTNKSPTGIQIGQLRLLAHHRYHNR